MFAHLSSEDDPTLKFTKAGKDHPMNKFFTDLGTAASGIKPASEGGSDEKVERALQSKVSLCRCAKLRNPYGHFICYFDNNPHYNIHISEVKINLLKWNRIRNGRTEALPFQEPRCYNRIQLETHSFAKIFESYNT